MFRSSVLFVVMAVCGIAAPHRFIIHPNTAITILAIAEGPDGFLWLAAQDGLYRFDGFHYQKMRNFPFQSARFIAPAGEDSLWIGGAQGLVRYQNRFDVLLREEVTALATLSDQVIVRNGLRYRSIYLDGSIQALAYDGRSYVTPNPSGGLWFGIPGESVAMLADPGRPGTILERVRLPDRFDQVVRDSQGRVWAADANRAVALKDGRQVEELRRRHSQKTERPRPLLAGRNGQVWFLGETIRELTNKLEFRDRALNDQYQPTAGYQDRRGHLWVARLGQGLIEWIPDPDWRRWFSDDFGGVAAAQVSQTAGGSMVACTHANLYRLDRSGETWTALAKTERVYAALLPLSSGDFLASIRKFGLARLSPTGEIVERPANPLPSADEYRILIEDGKNQLWVGNKAVLFRIEGRPGSLHLRREELPGIERSRNANSVDLAIDAAGRLWTGYAEGIAWLDDQDYWHKLPTDRPVEMVRSFALADRVKGEDIWVAYRGTGRFSRLQKKGDRWNVTDFTSAAGYVPEDSHFIKRDSRGWIWRGAPDGVHISDGIHVEPNDWIHISLQNGLATASTDQYGFFEDRNGGVWIAGEDGISHLKPDPAWFDGPRDVPPPRITRVEIDGHEAPVGTAALPPAKESLRIEVGSLDAPAFRDYPFRYRLKPLFTDWRLSRDGTFQFRQLPPDAYTLQVAFTGNGTSPELAYPFRVETPGTRVTWMWLLSFPLGGGALALFARWFPWPERIRYRFTKYVFLLRRRFTSKESTSSGDGDSRFQNHAGEIVAERYQLVRAVSRGGFSVVYEARDLHNDSARIAIKILNTGAGDEGWLRDRFAHEIAALRSVHHPAVVAVLDSWISPEGEPCLAMPFLEGPTLREALKSGPFSRGVAACMIRELGSAIAEIHGRGIVHRDLKPENVMLPDANRLQPVVIDFGTASLRGRRDQLARTTLLAGSFHYMAPERLTCHYSQASDVYSLGVMILELLTGKRLADLRILFSDDTFHDELERVVECAVGPDVAKAIVSELAKAYDPRPQGRPSDVRAWSGALAGLLERA